MRILCRALLLGCLLTVSDLSAQTYVLTGAGSPGNTSRAFAINSSGQVAGYGYPPAIVLNRAYLFENGAATFLGTLGGDVSLAFAINNAGVVVGQGTLSGELVTRAFVAFGGVIADLGTLGGTNSSARGINSAGVIVGYADTAGDTAEHAFRRTNGVTTDLGSLAGAAQDSRAFDVNDSGQIVGWTKVAGGKTRGFLFTTGAMAELDHLGGDIAAANAINNAGHIVGYSLLSGNFVTHAFLNIEGSIQDLGTLGGTTSEALGINEADQIVGYSFTASAASHAFLHENGTMKDLNDLVTNGAGWVLNYAYAINDSGQIAGVGQLNGNFRAFLLTPVRKAIASAPSLTVLGKKRITTTKSQLVLKGNATGSVTRVTWRGGKRGAFKTARGTTAWRFKAKLHSGSNKITIIAEGPGGKSTPAHVVAIRL